VADVEVNDESQGGDNMMTLRSS